MVEKTIKINITTSVELSLHKLAKKKKIAWNEALAYGIKELAKRKK